MAVSDDDLAEIIGAIERAPFEPNGWEAALRGAIRAGGGWGVQMLAQTPTGEMHFDVGVEIDPEIIDTYEAKGTSNPQLSPRTAAALRCAPLQVFCESDFITPEIRARHPMYQEVHLPYNAAYVCAARLNDFDGMFVGLGVLRSERQGHATAEDRRALGRLAPHLDAAFRLQMRLENQAANMAMGAFDAIRLPVIVCDAAGRATALSGTAQAIAAAGDYLAVRGRRIVLREGPSQQALDRAIAVAARAEAGATLAINAVPLRDAQGDVQALAEVAPLPRTGLFGVGTIMVLIKPAPEGESVLRRKFGLTVAEIAVAALARDGRSAIEIALSRGTTVETVRSQLRSIYGKLGVASRAKLIVRLQALMGGG